MIITERLQKYMEYKGLNPNQITVEASLSVGLIGKAIKQQRGLNSDTIEKILHRYKDINPTWFITGEGDMLKDPNVQKNAQTPVSSGVSINKETTEGELIIQLLKQENELLKDNLKLLKENKTFIEQENQRLKEELSKLQSECQQKEICKAKKNT